MLFRVVGGIGVGIASVIAPAYIAETSPPRIRGRLGSLQQLAIVSGIFLSFAINWLLQGSQAAPTRTCGSGMEAWRWMFLVMAIPALVYGLLAFTIPESPRYLVASHKIPEARKVLTMLLGEKNLEITIDRIKETLEREDKPSWRDLKAPTGGIYGIVWVGLGLSIFQQFVGINVIFYYSNVLWQAVGFSAEGDSFIITVITSVSTSLTTLIAIALIDKIGRKPLLLIGSTGMACHLVTMSVIFANGRRSARTASRSSTAPRVRSRWSPPTCSSSRSACPGARWSGCCSARCSPTASARRRSAWPRRGSGRPTGLITVTFPGLRDHLGLAYGFYGLCAILSFIFVWRWVQETKGVSLEDMHGEVLRQPQSRRRPGVGRAAAAKPP